MSLQSAFVFLLLMATQGRAIDIGTMTWTSGRSDWINVKSLPSYISSTSALGNGSTDDTVAIQAAFTYISNHSNGSLTTLYFPPGTYPISSTLTVHDVYGLQVIGSGSSTTVKWVGASGGAMFQPQNCPFGHYWGLEWDGNSLASCGFEFYHQNGEYETEVRMENLSFKNFTVTGTYTYADSAGNPTTGAPASAILTSFPQGQITADSLVYNCKFYNCTNGVYIGWQFYQVFEWHFNACQFENCGVGINGGSGIGYDIENTHFQNSTTGDIFAGAGYHLRRCTSSGSNALLLDVQGVNMVQDCWIDGWTNVGGALNLVGYGSDTVMDCTFTTPPAGAAPPIQTYGYSSPVSMILSGNYSPNFGPGLGLVNNQGYSPYGSYIAADVIQPGLRGGTVTSASQTFLKTTAFTDSAHILDVTQAPYSADPNYGTDATSAIQLALTTAKSNNNGSLVYIPVGRFKVSSTLAASGSNYTIQGAGLNSELIYNGTAGGSILTIDTPVNVVVQNLDFCPMASGPSDTADINDIAIKETATAASNITYDGVTYNWVYSPPAGPLAQQGDTDGPGIVLSALPSTAKVFIPYLPANLTVQNSGAAQVLVRNYMGGALNISGTGAKTGFMGVVDAENLASGYVISVTDNQNLVVGNHYTESDYNNVNVARGSGITPGHVSIEGTNDATKATSTSLNINNYAGRVFFGGYYIQNYNGSSFVPVILTQTGANAVDMILAGLATADGLPTITTGTGANLISTIGYNHDTTAFAPDTPNPLTPADLLSISNSLDDFRQLSVVDASVENAVTTDAPPVASYPMEQSVLDTTGSYNGTNNGATYGDAAVGLYGAVFNGTSSYISIPKSVTTNLSISMWIQTTDTGATGQWYAGKGLVDGFTAASAADFGTALNGGKFSLGVGSADTTLTSTVAVNDGKWHFLTATRNSTTGAMQVYIDGVLNNSVTGPTGTRSAGTLLRIGSIQTGVSTGFLNGSLDQVQIYNYVLTATEVAYLYNHSKGTSTFPAYWKLDETAGTTSADSTGNGHTGTWVGGPTFTTDHPSAIPFTDAGSLTFNGSTQYVSIANVGSLPAGNAPRTISAWAKTTTTTGNQFIASFGTASTNSALLIGMESGTLYGSGYNNDLTVPNAFNDTNWHYVALSFDGNTEKLYFDGVLRNSTAIKLNLNGTAGYIGNLFGGNSWNGSIDDVRIYGRALSTSDIANVEGLQAYWTLDEASGTTSADASGHGVTGTYVNGPTPTTDKPAAISFSDSHSLSFSAASSQYVTMGTPANLPSGTAARTICGWAKSNGIGGYGMFASYGTAANHEGFWIGANGSSLSAGSWGDDMTDIPGFWDGNWHFIALTYDGTNAKLYADGVLKQTAAKTWTLVPSVCYVGCYLNTACFWNGPVDDVRIYNRALSSTEITRLFSGNP